MPRPFGSRLDLSDQARTQLAALARAPSTPQALALRCRLVLRVADPDRPTNQAIAAEFGCDRHTVGLWRERFAHRGLTGLQDAPRPGRPQGFSPRRTPGGRHLGHAGHRRP